MFKPLPFNTWITNILGEAEFFADREGVKKAWVTKESNLSWHDFDEACEIMAGNEPGQHFMLFSERFSFEQREALGNFLHVFNATDDKATGGNLRQSVDSVALLHSDLWPPLEEAAKAVVKVFEGWEPPPEDKK